MKDLILYIHGRGGSAAESEHYRPLFPGCQVMGLEYHGQSPWEAGEEIRQAAEGLKQQYGSVTLVANSIGAFFAMSAGLDGLVRKAYFISPIVDMEGLIRGMMSRADVTEAQLRENGVIPTDFGEDLSWAYLCYVREHPVRWTVPTEILYGSCDDLTSYETVAAFAGDHRAGLTVMEGGEHWFHTEEQLRFLDAWILNGLEPLQIGGQSYRLLRLLGKGKGGYSYLARGDGAPVVVKQLHHEPCDYYRFGDKLEAELRDYGRLRELGIRIPAMIGFDRRDEQIVKEYIEGPTVMQLAQAGSPVTPYLPQVREMAARARSAGLNIDYYPANFVVRDGQLWYVDYECSEYSRQWDFEHWGILHWLPGVIFRFFREEDYEAVCDFLIALQDRDRSHMHWNWARFEWMFEHPEFDKEASSSIGLWWAGDKIVGAAIYDLYFGEAFCAALPEYEALYPAILDYAFRELKDDSGLGIAICDGNVGEIEAAKAEGFRPAEQQETLMCLELDRLPPLGLPEGFSLAELDPAEEPYAFQWLLWQGFDHGTDPEDFEREDPIVARVRRHFDRRLSLTALSPDGSKAAYCCVWLHPDTDYAYVEPVCTVPAYRGRGLAGALLSEALNRARSLGARSAYVISDLPFYEKLGFEKARHYTFYRKVNPL